MPESIPRPAGLVLLMRAIQRVTASNHQCEASASSCSGTIVVCYGTSLMLTRPLRDAATLHHVRRSPLLAILLLFGLAFACAPCWFDDCDESSDGTDAPISAASCNACQAAATVPDAVAALALRIQLDTAHEPEARLTAFPPREITPPPKGA